MVEIKSLSEAENYLSGIKVVVFDLDDTLYNEIDYVKSGFCCVAKVLPNIENAAEKLYKLFMQRKQPIDELLQAESCFSQNTKEKCLTAYRNQNPDLTLSDSVKKLLLRLKANGYRLGIITDGRTEGQKAKIKALGLNDLVDKIIITDEFGGIQYRKPNPKAFETMRDYFDVRFEEMCYIGDNITKDFIAPDMLGMKSIFFKNQKGLYLK